MAEHVVDVEMVRRLFYGMLDETVDGRSYDFKKSGAAEAILALSPAELGKFAVMGVVYHVMPDASRDKVVTNLLSLPKPVDLIRNLLDEKRYDELVTAHLAQRIVLWEKDVFRINKVLRTILRRKLLFDDDDILMLTNNIKEDYEGRYSTVNERKYLEYTVKIIKKHRKQTPLSPQLVSAITEKIARVDVSWPAGRHILKYVQALETLVVQTDDSVLNMKPYDQWSEEAVAYVADSRKRERWVMLINKCAMMERGKPSAKWLKEMEGYVTGIGRATLQQTVAEWLRAYASKHPERALVYTATEWSDRQVVRREQKQNELTLRNLVWVSMKEATPDLITAISECAVAAYKKIPAVGARNVSLGNACVWALSQIDHQDELVQRVVFTQPMLIKQQVKGRSIHKYIDQTINQMAEARGIAPHQLQEMFVDRFGLETVGRRTVLFGEYRAELTIERNKAKISWFKPDGEQQKSVPALVKKEHTDALNELKRTAKSINKTLSATKGYIESLYLYDASWVWTTWRERYHDHPLVGTIARRLIWRFERGDERTGGLWDGEQFVDAAGQPLMIPLDDETTVKLWHPLDELVNGDENGSAAILAWRIAVENREIRQPFKQAHREIYLLTDAERNTNSYSNRFAAHILRNHQFHALCEARNWRVGSAYHNIGIEPARYDVPQSELSAEFWFDSADGHEYVATDQVRFYDSREANPIPLERVPPLIFSELMRDVDLFVGVASVGNDPTWVDGGEQRNRHLGYWQEYAFGELSATAETRKQLLGRLIPRLKIGKKCSFDGRFFVVEGSLRTYKIHLGSGNILMKPDDQYLCIVPGQMSRTNKKADNVYLPFEGDRTMAIILSKAILLADDHKISDPTITHQIERK